MRDTRGVEWTSPSLHFADHTDLKVYKGARGEPRVSRNNVSRRRGTCMATGRGREGLERDSNLAEKSIRTKGDEEAEWDSLGVIIIKWTSGWVRAEKHRRRIDRWMLFGGRTEFSFPSSSCRMERVRAFVAGRPWRMSNGNWSTK